MMIDSIYVRCRKKFVLTEQNGHFSPIDSI